MLSFDVLANTGPLRHRPAVEKVVPSLILMVTALALPPVPTALLVLATTTTVAIGLAGLSLDRWLRAVALPAGFIVAGVIGIALDWGDGPGPLPLTVSSASANEAGLVFLRSLAGTSAVILLGVTTPMVDLIALLRRLRVPAAVTDLMASMYRLVFDLLDTGRRLRQSQAARLGHDGLHRSVRSSGLVASAVFIRSVHRARRLQIGLDARGYDGELRVLSPARPVDPVRLGIGIGAALAVPIVSLAALAAWTTWVGAAS